MNSLNKLPELPNEFLHYNYKDKNDILNILSVQLGNTYRQGILSGYEDLDAAFMAFLIEAGFDEETILSSYKKIFLDNYNEQKTSQMYERTKTRLEFGEQVRGAGSFIFALQERGLTDLENLTRKLSPQQAPPLEPTAKEKADTIKSVLGCVMDATRLFAETDDTEWLCHGLLPRRSVSVVAGSQKGGKTWYAIEVGTAHSIGRDIFGVFPCYQGKTLFIEGDMPDENIKWRLANGGYKYDPANFLTLNKFTLARQGQILDLSTATGMVIFEDVVSHIKPDLVILDSFSAFHTTEEKEASTVKPIITFLSSIAHKYNVHVMIIHHTRKRANQEEKRELTMNEIIGTNVLLRFSSIIYGVQRTINPGNDEPIHTLTSLGSWFKPIQPVILSIKSTEEEDEKVKLDWSSVEQLPKNKTSYACFIIERSLRSGGKRRSDFIEEMPAVSPSTIDRALSRLLDKKRIVRHGPEHSNNSLYMHVYIRSDKERKKIVDTVGENGLSSCLSHFPKMTNTPLPHKLGLSNPENMTNSLTNTKIVAAVSENGSVCHNSTYTCLSDTEDNPCQRCIMSRGQAKTCEVTSPCPRFGAFQAIN